MDLLKKILPCLIALLFSIFANAQKRIVVEGSRGNAYINYTVRPGETISSISQQFKTDVSIVMNLNRMTATSKLGRTIKIPFNPSILSQDKNAAALPTAVIHKVEKGENLYRISIGHNKVDMETLKKWNGLAPNAIVEEGQDIIVGFVNLKGAVVADASKTKATDLITANTNKTTEQITKTAQPDPAKNKTEKLPVTAPVKQAEIKITKATVADTKTEDKKISDDLTAAPKNNAAKNAELKKNKNETSKEKPVEIEEDKNTIQSKAADNFAANATIKELETKDAGIIQQQPPVNNEPVQQPQKQPEQKSVEQNNNVYKPLNTGNIISSVNSTDTIRLGESGFFAKAFGKGVEGRTLETLTGTAMTFRSISGWNDKKFYILMNDVPPGSIVKVSNGSSRYLYAKVLWNLGGIKENEGLDFRVSNAAAAALGITESKFPLIVTYYE